MRFGMDDVSPCVSLLCCTTGIHHFVAEPNLRHLDCFFSSPLGLCDLSLPRHANVNNFVDELRLGQLNCLLRQPGRRGFVRVHVGSASSATVSSKIESGISTSHAPSKCSVGGSAAKGRQTMEKHTRSRMSLSRSVEDVTRTPCASGKKPWRLHRQRGRGAQRHAPPAPLVVSSEREGQRKRGSAQESARTRRSPDRFHHKSFGEASTEEDKTTMIVVKDETTGCVAAHVCEQQTNGWLSECVTTLISSDTVELEVQ